MTKLQKQKCIPCKSDTLPMSKEEIKMMQKEVPKWEVREVDGVHHLRRRFKFDDFAGALSFTNQVGEAAEEEGHHPVIELTWGRATVTWWTHDVDGLHKNDFIMAAKSDEIYQSM